MIPAGIASTLKEYTINLLISVKNPAVFEVNFCNQYSLIFDSHNVIKTGVYHSGKEPKKQLISTIKYTDLPYSEQQLTDYEICLKCNLSKESISVFINGRCYETLSIPSNNKLLNFYVSLNNQTQRMDILFLKKIYIYNEKGERLLNIEHKSFPQLAGIMLHYKNCSFLLFLLGIMILFFLFVLSAAFRHKWAYLAAIVIFAEFFLRTTNNNNPYCNINLLLERPAWNIEKLTNLFGNYDNITYIEIYDTGNVPPLKRYQLKYDKVKPKNIKRIICLGTSSTEGSHIRYGTDVYSSLLEKELRLKKGKNYQVINAGLGGHETFRIFIYFRDVLLKLEPDIVTIYLGENDSINDIRSIYLEYLRIEYLRKKHSGWIDSQRLLLMSLDFRFPIKGIVEAYDFLHNSYLFMATNHFRKILFNKIYRTILKSEINAKSNQEISQESLENIIEICLKKGIKVLLIPELSSYDYNNWEQYRSMMENVSKKHKNVYYLDLRDTFITNNNTALFYDNVHPTEYGHKLIAEAIYHKLVTENLI